MKSRRDKIIENLIAVGILVIICVYGIILFVCKGFLYNWAMNVGFVLR